MVIEALINAHAEAARELARLMDPVRDAAIAGNHKAFETAEAVHKQAYLRCEALKLALEIARATFLKANNAKRH